VDDTGWDADIAAARDDSPGAGESGAHDDTAPQPVVGHDGLPHHHEAGTHPHQGQPTDRESSPGHHISTAPIFGMATLVHDHEDAPRHTDELVRRIPGARLSRWDDEGHLAVVHHVGEVLDALIEANEPTT